MTLKEKIVKAIKDKETKVVDSRTDTKVVVDGDIIKLSHYGTVLVSIVIPDTIIVLPYCSKSSLYRINAALSVYGLSFRINKGRYCVEKDGQEVGIEEEGKLIIINL